MKTENKTVRKIVLKTQGVIWIKIIYSLFKRMSFIKVKDPRKREELIRDFIETRKRIKDNFIAKKVGESEYQTGLTKLFKPVTETQKATAKEITETQKTTAEKITQELLPIKESIGELATKEDIQRVPMKVFNQIFPSLEFKSSEVMELGTLAVYSLIEAFTKEGVDKTFGLHAKNKKFHIGDKPVTIKDNDIIIDGKIYSGSPGLWELITSRDPKKFTEEDYKNYMDLLVQTNTIYQDNNSNNTKPKSSGGSKWVNLISPIWEEIKPKKGKKKKKKRQQDPDEDEEPQPSTSGTGLKILPSDPNALIECFDLLFSSQNAGHTGVRNEIVSILDELKRQGVLKTNEYKKLNSLIKK